MKFFLEHISTNKQTKLLLLLLLILNLINSKDCIHISNIHKFL